MEERYKNIESYLGNTMLPEERKRFEEVLQQDATLKEEVSLYKQLNFYLKQDGPEVENLPQTDFTNKVRAFLNTEEAQNIRKNIRQETQGYEPQQKVFSIKHYRWAAAILLLLIVSIMTVQFFNRSNTPQELYASYYQEKDLPSLIKRDHRESILYTGINNFKAKDYQQALADFEGYESSGKAIDTAFFLYKGVTQLHLDQPDAAIASFDLVANSQLLNHSKGIWFKALAYLKLDDTSNAKAVLKEIVQQPENFNSDKAQLILDEF